MVLKWLCRFVRQRVKASRVSSKWKMSICRCSLGAPALEYLAVTVMQGDSLPSPNRSELLAQSRSYLKGPFDKLVVDMFEEGELSE
jgi:hypothetical protein